MKKISVVSSFIPAEGRWDIKKISLEEAKNLLQGAEVAVYSGHQTVKILGLSPAEGRPIYVPAGETQLWVKPKGRLDFGREYTAEEIEQIGYDIFVAEPVEG